jgi:hypothetical protein
MTSPLDDPFANEPPGSEAIDPRAAAAVLREARAALVDEGRPAARLVRLWTGVVLPAVLVACGLVYTWGAVQTIEHIYVAGR